MLSNQKSTQKEQRGKGQRPLLWIHKTAHSDSLSNSESREKRSINSHAQRWHRRQLRQTKTADQEDNIAPITPPSPVSLPFDECQAYFSIVPAGEAEKGNSPVDIVEPSKDGAGVKKVKKEDDPEMMALKTKVFIPVRYSVDAVDPFDSLRTNIDQQAHRLIQYFIDVAYPAFWQPPTEDYTDSKLALQTVAQQVVRAAITSQTKMFTLMASMASRLENVDNVKVKGGASYYILRALTSVRRNMNNGVIDDNQIYAVFNLFAAEEYRQNFSEALTHLRAARSLIDSLGGLAAVDKPLMATMVVGDLYLAAELLRKPLFPLVFDPGNASVALKECMPMIIQTTSLSQLGQGLRENDFVGEETRAIVEDLSEFAQVTENAKPDQADIQSWLRFRNLALRHRVLSLTINDLYQRCLQISLFIWITKIRTAFRWRNIHIMSFHLYRTMSGTECAFWLSNLDLASWMLSIGAMSAKNQSDEQDFFLEHLGRFHRGTDSKIIAADLAQKSLRFFYVDKLQRSTLENVADRLADRNAQSGNLAPSCTLHST